MKIKSASEGGFWMSKLARDYLLRMVTKEVVVEHGKENRAGKQEGNSSVGSRVGYWKL